ncbi:TIGR02117 family protein [soil metagenome]
MGNWKIYFRYFCFAILGFFGLLMLYFLMAFILGVTPVNRGFRPPTEGGINIFVASNGVHTDIIVPVRTPFQDWSELIPYGHFAGIDTATYIALGWGDKGFYIHTPTWDDLTVTTALRSLFWPTAAAMHTEYFRGEPRLYQWKEQLVITEEQYQRFVAYAKKYFQEGPNGNFILIEGAGYQDTDNFYEAHGRYHVYNTSNNWSNRALKKMGVRAAVWAPFDRAIRYQVRKANERAEKRR